MESAYKCAKGIAYVIAKMAMSVNDMEVNVIFLGLKVFISDNFRMFSCSENAQVTYANN